MSSAQSVRREERGLAIAFLAVALLVMVVALGLALDSGRVFLARQRLQHAVDTAVLGHMDYVNRFPDRIVREDAVATATENLKLARYANDISTVDALADGSRARLAVWGEVNVPLLFLPVLPGMPHQVSVQARASAGAKPLAIVLVLDISSSMEEPLGSEGGDYGQPIPTKLKRLQAAVTDFINQLDQNDYLGIVAFAGSSPCAGNGSVPIRQLSRLRNPQDAIRQVNELRTQPTGTCIACGLRCASWSFANPAESAPPPPDAKRVVILFTDGAPVHGNYLLEHEPSQNRGCGWPAELGYHGDQISLTGRNRFYMAIAESDLLRAQNIAVHTIGVGRVEPTTSGDICRGLTPDYPFRNPWQRLYCTLPPGLQHPTPEQGAPDLQLLRPFLLMRIANTIDVDQEYSPPPNETALTYDQATGEIHGAFPPFLPNLQAIPDAVISPACDRDLNAAYCACTPRTGPDFPRGLFLAANDSNQIAARFRRIFDVIKAPRFTE